MAKAPTRTSRGDARSTPPALAGTMLHNAPSFGHGAGRVAHPGAESSLVIHGPASGWRLSPFALTDSDGRIVDLWGYRQRLNFVLFFHHGASCPSCRSMLELLAERVTTFRDAEAAVLGIGLHDVAESRRMASAIGFAFPLLSDPSGQAVAKQGLEIPSVVVSDRYGEIWAAWSGGQQHALPDGAEIERWLEFVELQCPECGVAEWPPLPSDVMME